MRVDVPERGSVLVSPRSWSGLAASSDFWRLERDGVVAVRHEGPNAHRLVGKGWVGRAYCDEIELHVVEKIPGAVRDLAHAITGRDVRATETAGPATDLDELSRFLFEQLIDAADAYVRERRRARYEYEPAAGPTLSGAWDIAATLQLWASGRSHLFAYSRGQVVRDSPLDRALLAALLLIDTLADLVGLEPRARRRALALAAALDDVRDEAFLTAVPDQHITAAELVETARDTSEEDRDLARLVQAVLAELGLGLAEPPGAAAPRAVFINLETLWEFAVLRTLQRVLPDNTVDRGDRQPRTIFSGGVDRGLANPDVVVATSTQVLAVGDAKWKAIADQASASFNPRSATREDLARSGTRRPDLYQVLAHAEALKASTAFLVYPSDALACGPAPATRYHGQTSGGRHTWTVRARPACLLHDLATFVKDQLRRTLGESLA